MKPSSKIVATAVVASFILALVGLFHSQAKAVMWHLVHGRDVTWDNHVVTLPIWWTPSVGSSGGSLKLTRATLFGADVELNVTKKGSAALLESSDAALHWQEESLPKMASGARSEAFKAYTVVTAGGEVFCVGSAADDVSVSFVCRVTGTDWDVRFLGDETAASDARAIVGSLR
ncbi:hypothetical protein [Granulicella aggregans]|uniref:hypothetical protein n=1 Tax=Granulicella aggregans TaxID=474949 RepID=UPI0021E0B1A2|nr:hypothetical protein [Granulicella aggregans]